MSIDLPDIDAAQAKLNRAVSRWAIRRTETEGSQVELDLFQAQRQFREVCEAAFMAAARTNPEVIGIVNPPPPEYVIPEAPMARELRIANLLAVVNYPHPIPGGDLVRKEAVRRALVLLDLDQVPAT